MYKKLLNGLKNYFQLYTGIPTQCWILIILGLIEAAAVGICYFLSVYFVNYLHFSVFTVGLLMSAYGTGTILGGFIAGKISDIISSTKISFISLFVQSIAFLLLNELRSIEFLTVNMFLLGVSAYGFKTSNDLSLLNYSKNNENLKVKVITIARVALNLGLGISGIIIGLCGLKSFQFVFYFFGFLLLLSAFYLMLDRRNIIGDNKEKIAAHLPLVSQNYDPQKIYLILGCLFCVGLLIAQLSSTYPIFVQNAFPYLGSKGISSLYLLDTFLIILFQVAVTNLVKDYNKILIAGFGAFLMGLGMLILNYSTFFGMAIVSCLIWTTGEMLFIPTAQLVCYDNSGDKKGEAMGWFQSTYALSAIVGPILGGFIYQYLNVQILWVLCTLLGLMCLGSCIFYYYRITKLKFLTYKFIENHS